MVTPIIISNFNDYGIESGYSNTVLPVSRRRMIIVANQLPLQALKDTPGGEWRFSFDEDSLIFQMKDGLRTDNEVYYVGSLNVDIDASKQEEVARLLLENYRCIPTFLPPELHRKFYHGFCKKQLWPLVHYMLPLYPDYGERFDWSLWQAYISANKIFADKVTEVIDPDTDYVWIHDYHLMALPTLLRKNVICVKIGFFLHCPFPTSEIYNTLPVREEILKSLLNCDLIGFHTFDYARHFLSCCARILGLNYELKRGYIGIVYIGRTVGIKILHVGIHLGRLQSLLNFTSTQNKVREIHEQFQGKKLIVGVDDMDIFKGISLKLLAVEQLLKKNPELQGTLILVQIVNPVRSMSIDVQKAVEEVNSIANRINEHYGKPGYDPVILIDSHVPHYEKVAYYVAAECCIVNAVRDGMNLVPYEYVVCRQGTRQLDEAMGVVNVQADHASMIVLSEFVGCSPSLSGAIRVNPWDVATVSEGLKRAIFSNDTEKQMCHEKHYRYITSHDIAYWACSFEQDLVRSCKDHNSKQWWCTGLGLNYRVIALSKNFSKLSVAHVVSAYNSTNRRAIFLDYDGTLMSQSSVSKTPGAGVILVLNSLCSDPKNMVFIVSGRARSPLSQWFSQCESLGLAAEHGYFVRWNKASDWETCSGPTDFNWKGIVEPVMQVYTDSTDGSFIESKESAMVWHHEYADAQFGASQAKEMLDHLEKVLANDPVVVKSGEHIVEVKPQGVSKGLVAEKILCTMVNCGKSPDFVMCIGDDRSDEDMFESISETALSRSLGAIPEIFACTVGQKPSKAKFYLDDTLEVINLLQGLVSASDQLQRPVDVQVSFEAGVIDLTELI